MLKYIMAASIHFAQITKKQDLLPNKQQQCYGIQLSSISKKYGAIRYCITGDEAKTNSYRTRQWEFSTHFLPVPSPWQQPSAWV